MEKHSSFAKIVYILALIATIIGFTAFSQEPPKNNSFRPDPFSKENDTTKPAKRNRNADSRRPDQLDIQLDHLDVEMKNLDVQMQHLDEQMKQVDLSKIEKDAELAMKNVDMEKINAELDGALKKIDWNDVNTKMNKSLAKANKAQMAEVGKQIEKARLQLEKQKLNMHFSMPDIDTKKIKLKTDEAMKNARKSIEKAKEEIQNLRDFTNALQNDGLIDKSKPYKVELKDGELYINGAKQSKEVSDKYKHFYKKENFTIDMNEGNGTHI